jgi:hypothetical protein
MFIYNAATNSTQAGAPMPQAGGEYGMTMLNSGAVLVCGGGSTNTCWVYTVGVNTWTTFTPLPAILAFFPMLTLHGRPYVFGGSNDNNIVFNTVYTFESNAWKTRTPMETTLEAHSAVVLGVDTALVYAHSAWMDCGCIGITRAIHELNLLTTIR